MASSTPLSPLFSGLRKRDPSSPNALDDNALEPIEFAPAAEAFFDSFGGKASVAGDGGYDPTGGAGAGAVLLNMTTINGRNYFSGDRNIDAALIGSRWINLNQTFSFPATGSLYVGYTTAEPTTGFSAFNAAQQASARYALGLVSSYTQVTFTEITETASVHANHRFADTTLIGSAQGHFPSTDVAAGDTWFNLGQPFYPTPAIGNWGAATIMHEIGHTMGLKHGHQDYTTANLAGDLFVGGTRFGSQALSDDVDFQAYSLMTYQGAQGQETNPGSTSFQGDASNQPQSYMMEDIAALQFMYGANYTINGGASVYTFSTTTGEMFINAVSQGVPAANIVFRTVWDGGGVDTYNLNNYTTDLSLNLEAGGWLVFDTNVNTHLQRANNSPLSATANWAPGNVANALLYNNDTRSLIENAIGGSGNDVLVGNRVGNQLTGNNGNDTMYGGGADDSLIGGIGNDVLYGDNGPIVFGGTTMGSGLIQHSQAGNNSIGSAMYIGDQFSLANNDDIYSSTTIPHTTVRVAASGNTSANYYWVTLTAGSTIFLDIDRTSLNSYLQLKNASGTVIAFNDDNNADPGSTSNFNSSLAYTVATTGVYYIEVGYWAAVDTLPSGSTYDLNVSVRASESLGYDGVAGNDLLEGDAGNDALFGGLGVDTAVYTVARAASTLTRNANGTVTVNASTDGLDTLNDMEWAQFTTSRVWVGAQRDDVTRDGSSDVLLRNTTTGQVYFWGVSGNAVASQGLVGTTDNAWTLSFTGDFNQDRSADMLFRNAGTGEVAIWDTSNGSVSASVSVGVLATNWNMVGVGDFNADGSSDILWRDSTTGLFADWDIVNNQVSSSNVVGNTGLNWQVVGTGYFNNDNTSDILLRDQSTGQVVIWDVVNNAVSTSTFVGTLGSSWSVAGIGDFNSDGFSDILWRDNGGSVAIWDIANNSLLTSASVGFLTLDWQIANVGDFNGDFTSDILWRNVNNGQIAAWDIVSNTVNVSAFIGSTTTDWQNIAG